MNISYLILAHNNPQLLISLINRLNDDNVDFFIHIDKKSKDKFDFLERMANVHFFSNRLDVHWGDISMVQTILMCCRIIANKKGDDTNVILLSGLDYPAKSNQYIKNFLLKNNKNFITGAEIPSKECKWLEHGKRRLICYSLRLKTRKIATIEPRKINIGNLKQLFKVFLYNPLKINKAFKIFFFYPKRKHPNYIIPYGGEFWWVLSIDTIRIINKFVDDHPDFLKYHEDTSIPDELFINTIVYNCIKHEDIINNCLRFINWKSKPSPLNVTINDKKLICKCCEDKDILFIRKVIDNEARLFIDNYISEKNF